LTLKIRWLAGAACALALSACADGNTKHNTGGQNYDQLMQQAESNVRSQNADGAKLYFNKAASADPTRKEPWFRLAQLNFNQQNYGGAIVSAQEVLQRDASDVDAESILTVAGLRVAVEALGRLHDENNLQGPAHQEAEKLAAKLRDTLGEDILVPRKAPQRATVYHRSGKKAAAQTAAAPETAATPVATPTAPEAAPIVTTPTPPPASTPPATSKPASADPFSALPGRGN
jgi:tetratricopeptide (TPR) repeat protein